MDIALTTKSQDALGAAVRIAAAGGNAQVEPLHLVAHVVGHQGFPLVRARPDRLGDQLAHVPVLQQLAVVVLHGNDRPPAQDVVVELLHARVVDLQVRGGDELAGPRVHRRVHVDLEVELEEAAEPFEEAACRIVVFYRGMRKRGKEG